MALQEDQINRIIRGFISRLEQDIPVHEVILFGSYKLATDIKFEPDAVMTTINVSEPEWAVSPDSFIK